MGTRRIYLHGDIDLGVTSALRARLVTAATEFEDSDLIVDCRDVAFMDSTAVSEIMAAYLKLSAKGRRLGVVNVRPAIRRVFDILGLAEILEDEVTVDPPLNLSR